MFIETEEYKHIIWNNVDKIDTYILECILFNDEKRWKLAPDIFMKLDHFKYAFKDFDLLERLIKVFPEKYKSVQYYDLVCDKNLEVIRKLLELGFSPQTHFGDIVNRNWIDGIVLCQQYGAVLDESARYHLERHNKPEVKKLFEM